MSKFPTLAAFARDDSPRLSDGILATLRELARPGAALVATESPSSLRFVTASGKRGRTVRVATVRWLHDHRCLYNVVPDDTPDDARWELAAQGHVLLRDHALYLKDRAVYRAACAARRRAPASAPPKPTPKKKRSTRRP